MELRKRVCFTFVGDPGKDSRLRRFVSTLSTSFDISIVALAEQACDDTLAAEIVVLPPGSPSLRSALPAFWRKASKHILRWKPDVIIAADLYSLSCAARAAETLAVPLCYDSRELYSDVAALHNRPLTQRFWTLYERRYARRARKIFTVNESIAEELRTRGYDVLVLRNLPDGSVHERSTLLRETLGIHPDMPIILSQGGVQRGRGVDIALRAIREIEHAALVFLGDGPLREHILRNAEHQDCRGRVHVVRAVPAKQLLAWTCSADIGLCLVENLGRSYYLSLPNKLFEYIAAGIPVLGSDFPEIGRVLHDTGTGITVSPDDFDAIVRTLRMMLYDRELREKFRENCLAAAPKLQWSTEEKLLLTSVKELT